MSRAHVFVVVGLASVLLAAGCGQAEKDPLAPAVEEREGAAAAPPGGGGSTPPYDPCAGYASGAAEATLTMGAGVTEREQQLAAPVVPVPPFPQPTCPARFVDVLVSSSSSPNPADCSPNGCYPAVEIAAGAGSFPGSSLDPDSDYFYLPTTSSTCTGYRHFVRLYKKLWGQSSFTLVRQFDYVGQWANGFCTIKDPSPPAGQAPYFPNDLIAPVKPLLGTDTYRVVAAVQIGLGNYVPVRFKAGYEPMR